MISFHLPVLKSVLLRLALLCCSLHVSSDSEFSSYFPMKNRVAQHRSGREFLPQRPSNHRPPWPGTGRSSRGLGGIPHQQGRTLHAFPSREETPSQQFSPFHYGAPSTLPLSPAAPRPTQGTSPRFYREHRGLSPRGSARLRSTEGAVGPASRLPLRLTRPAVLLFRG